MNEQVTTLTHADSNVQRPWTQSQQSLPLLAVLAYLLST